MSAKKEKENRSPGVNLTLRKPLGARKSFQFMKTVIGADGKRKNSKHECEALKSINNGFKKRVILYNDALELAENLRKSELEKIKLKYGFSCHNPSNSTNKSIINRYLAEEYSKRKNIKERTKQQIKYEFYAVSKILGPEISLLKDDRDTIYYQILANMDYSDESKRRLVCRFNALLKFVGRDFTIPKMQIQRSKNIPHLTEDELEIFVSNMRQEIDKIAARIIFYTGVRTGELFGLQEKDINFKNRTMSIERQLTRDLVIQKPKNNKDRDIIFPTKIKKDLEKWLELSEIYKRENIARLSKRFLAVSREIWGHDASKDISPHDLRRSFAIDMLQKGFSITEIALLLGDSEKVVQMYYSGYSANKVMLEKLKKKMG